MKTKSTPPADLLQGISTHPIIEVYYEFNQLKLLYRQGWLKRGLSPVLCESVAEHTLGVAILSMLLADQYFPHLDRQKVLRMALLHDFGEIFAGDITPADGVALEHKSRLESNAVSDIFSLLPNGESYIDCWQEFERGESPEARFVNQIDKLEMALQASIYAHQGIRTPEEFIDSARKAISDPELKDIMESIDGLMAM
jgi:putative hydrolase of HD superfamily